MMKVRILRSMLGLVPLLALISCQSNYTYEPIVANAPNVEMAEAQCQMMSSGTQQGYIAYGTQAYVTGAAIGNAVGNAIAADQFVRQCMTMQGWRRVSKPEAHTAAARRAAPISVPSAKDRATAVDALGMRYIAQKCSVSLKPADRENLDRLASTVDASIAAEGRTKGAKIYNDQVKLSGRAATCKKAEEIVRNM